MRFWVTVKQNLLFPVPDIFELSENLWMRAFSSSIKRLKIHVFDLLNSVSSLYILSSLGKIIPVVYERVVILEVEPTEIV